MSRTVSPSVGRRYGLALVCRVWEVARSSVYARRTHQTFPPPQPRKRGPKTRWSDAELTARLRAWSSHPPTTGVRRRSMFPRISTTSGKVPAAAPGWSLERAAALIFR